MKLVADNDPILRETMPVWVGPCSPLAAVSFRMFQLMKRKKGCGLAAPQVGLLHRMFVMRGANSADIGDGLVCINPEIISSMSPRKAMEGCLSFPGKIVAVERHDTIHVSFTNLLGRRRDLSLHGQLARCFQHELDHLNGITHLDHAEVTAS